MGLARGFIWLIGLGFWLVVAGVAPATAQECGCTNCPVSLPDNLTTTFQANIFVDNESNDILGVNNALERVCLDIQHTWIGDLDITLTSPDGTTIVLFADGNSDQTMGGTETCPCGNSNDDMRICFTLPGTTSNIFGTEGAGNCTDQAYLDPCNGSGPCYTGNWGTWNEGCHGGTGLAEFNNGSGTVSGFWTLTVNDNAGADLGILHDVYLVFSTPPTGDCSTDPPPADGCANGTTVSIPDNTGVPAYSVITNSGSAGTMNNGTTISSVCVLIDHTWIGDLDIWLYEPDGTGINLSANNGGSSDDYGNVSGGQEVCFTPTASTSINSYTGGQTGNWLPEGNFQVFNGTPNGDWLLAVWDDASLDNGSLLSWSIEFDNGDCSPECFEEVAYTAYFCPGDSYLFNGTPLSTAGIYTDTVAGPVCDSIVTLTLEERPTHAITVQQTSCDPAEEGTEELFLQNSYGCDSVVTVITELLAYDSTGITQYTCDPALAGTVTNTLQNTAGCDSLVTVVTQLRPGYTLEIYNTSCEASEIGVEVLELFTIHGCDSVVTIYTEPEPLPQGSAFLSVCPGDSATVNGVDYYSSPGVYTDTLIRPGCDSVVTLTLEELPTHAVTVQQTTCNPSEAGTEAFVLQNSYGCDSVVTVITELLAYDSTGVTQYTCDPALAGTVTDTLQNTAGCDSLVTVVTLLHPSYSVEIYNTSCEASEVGVEVLELFTVHGCDSLVTIYTEPEPLPQGSAFLSICPGDSATVNGVDYYATPGVYTDTLNLPGCDSVVVLTLVVENPPNTVSGVSLCEGDSISVDGVTWYSETGTYEVLLPDNGPCGETITLSLVVRPLPRTDLTRVICSGDSATINGIDYYSEPGVYTDTLAGFACDSIVTLALEMTEVLEAYVQQTTCYADEAGVETLYLTSAAGCDSIVTIETVFAGLALDTLLVSPAGCDGQGGAVTAVVAGGTAPFTFVVFSDLSMLNPSGQPDFRGLEAGRYTMQVTDSRGCTAARSFTVSAPDAVRPVASPRQVSMLYGETITLSVEPAGGEINWSPPAFLSCADCPVTEASPPYSEVFVVSVSRNGCTGTDTVVVEVIQPELLIPTGFSPNGDGHNDLFQVIDRYIDEFLFLRVYNRWGELVFESTDISRGWDGTFNGKGQEADTYLYHVGAVLYNGRVVEQAGNVLLLH